MKNITRNYFDIPQKFLTFELATNEIPVSVLNSVLI